MGRQLKNYICYVSSLNCWIVKFLSTTKFTFFRQLHKVEKKKEEESRQENEEKKKKDFGYVNNYQNARKKKHHKRV